MADDYAALKPGLSDPGVRFAEVTPDDGTDLAYVARALYVGGAGDVVAVSPAGDEATFPSVPAGQFLPVRAVRVKATGTTATGIVALW